MALTAKQQAFVDSYLTCWNAAEAARRAGYAERSARQMGSENLSKPDIAKEIQARIAEQAMSADEVLARLAEQARGVDSSYYNGSLGMLYLDAERLIADGKAHLIKKVTYGKDGDISSVELYDAQAALVHIGRHHQLFSDKIDLTSGGLPLKGYVGISPDDWDADDDEDDDSA